MGDQLRIGLLGCGSFAQRHAQNLQILPDEVEMVAFCDRNIGKASEFAQQFGRGEAAVFHDHQEMFNQTLLDAVVITLPPFAHSDEVAMAAERGIHVFIEKPIALRAEDGWRMVEAAEQAGITTQVGFMYRFGEAVETLKSFIDDGTAGPVGLMSARYFCNSLHAPWWRDRERSGGQLVEQVIHMVDLMRYLMGEPLTVYSRQENMFHRDVPGYTAEDISATVYGFPSGGVGVIYATNGAIPNRWINDYRVVSQKITADFNNANNATLTFTADPQCPPLVITSERNVHLAEMQDFLQAIRNGGRTRTPIREGAKSLDMALAAAKSARERGEINLA
ncbi:MAG: Gfo/Idh/MocA family oxidoreductase [Candidatus Promineifilaceae bacterium]|nr:Gfo/Idh/MocA family oxidoreductase [Candidatus Promineifilaceae bacterium]